MNSPFMGTPVPVGPVRSGFLPSSGLPELLPRVPIAICPYCGCIYSESMAPDGSGLEGFAEHHGSHKNPAGFCEHFVLAQFFYVSLADEAQGSRQPRLLGNALGEGLKSRAVINTLPFFQVKSDGFVNRMLLFAISYYGETEWQVKKIGRLVADGQEEKGQGQTPELDVLLAEGRLSWLEKGATSPRRRTGSIDEFPFTREFRAKADLSI